MYFQMKKMYIERHSAHGPKSKDSKAYCPEWTSSIDIGNKHV